MPRLNFYLIFAALVLFFLSSGVTLRDRVLVETLHKIEENALVEPSAKMLFEGAMSGMARKLNFSFKDRYSDFIPFVDQKGYEDGLDNRFDGIGIIYRQNLADEQAEILYPILGSPAFQRGLRSGDKILSVEGRETKGMSIEEVAELFKVELGKEVKLSVLPYGESEPKTISVPRAPIQRDSVEGDGIDSEGKRIFFLHGESDIAYIRIRTFSDRTAVEVQDALLEIADKNAKGLIIDLRDNPGGYISICVRIANFFLSAIPGQDVIVSTRYRNGALKSSHRIQEGNQICTLPIVVLIDGESASASEIFSAALQDYSRATIVGTRSFGKGVVQEIFSLPLNSGTLQLTDASYWRPSNQNIHRGPDAKEEDQWGVTPDSVLPISKEQRFVTLQIRDRRSNFVSEHNEALWAEFLERLPKEIEEHREELFFDDDFDDDDTEPSVGVTPKEETAKPNRSETWFDLDEPSEQSEPPQEKVEEITEPKKNEPEEPFTLQGKAPFYDPQLDRAVEILRRKIDENL